MEDFIFWSVLSLSLSLSLSISLFLNAFDQPIMVTKKLLLVKARWHMKFVCSKFFISFGFSCVSAGNGGLWAKEEAYFASCQRSMMENFARWAHEYKLSSISGKKLHHRCFTGFLISLWDFFPKIFVFSASREK